MTEVLSDRVLNRTTLARQGLLERRPRDVLDTVEHLVGLQAQEPKDPYVALWCRLDGFDPADLEALLCSRAVARVTVMRGTIHLVSARDALGLRPHFVPLARQQLLREPAGAALTGVDLDGVLAAGREVLAEGALSPAQLADALAPRFPGVEPDALVRACRFVLPLVQVPPRGLWHRSGAVRQTTFSAWFGREDGEPFSLDDVIRRYLRAFGPASVQDAATWSRLTGLRPVFERLRPELRTYRDARGRELFDVADGEIVDADVPAPTRFLPTYDNVLLSHADRSRFHDEATKQALSFDLRRIRGNVLHDGRYVATWRRGGDGAVEVHAIPLPRSARREIEAEAARLVSFTDGGAAAVEVRFLQPT